MLQAPAEQPGHRRAAPPHLPGHLFHRQPLQVLQVQGSPLVLGQPRQGAGQAQQLLLPLQPLAGAGLAADQPRIQPGRRLNPYISGGLGLGWIDSHANIFGGQGQDFTFNILTAAGISYKANDHWKIDIGVLYQHLSNGGQTDPNPSLNLVGPQIGVTYSF